jgi:hypothetical protein
MNHRNETTLFWGCFIALVTTSYAFVTRMILCGGQFVADFRLDKCCRLLYHGDFDYAGIGITNLLINRYSVEPWRMTATDYTNSAAVGPLLRGKYIAATWDAHLCPLLQESGHAVLEESVLESLLADLSLR